MRRGSLVFPLLLIALGLLFLANNLRPEIPVLDLLATYWPFILIGWGSLRLIEILWWASRGRRLPAAGISGGEWSLIVIVTLVGSGVFAAQRFTSRWPHGRIGVRGVEVFGESYDFPLSAERAAGKKPRVVIENFRGNTRITGGETDQVKITGRKTIRALQKSDADQGDKQTPVEIVQQGDRIVVRTNLDRYSGDSRTISADLEIAIPRESTLQLQGRYGDFDVTGINGDVEVKSENAGVRLHEISGNARLELDRSDIVRVENLAGNLDLRGGRGQDVELDNIRGQATLNGSFSGELSFRNLAKPLRYESSQTELRVEQLPGQIRMALGDFTAENLVGPIRLKTKTRDVQITDFTDSIEIALERGDVDLRSSKSPLPKMDVHTKSGNIVLSVPAVAGFDLKAATKRGEVSNDYGAPLRVESEDRGGVIAGTVGSGPALRLNTDRGSVTIRKAGAGESAPKRPKVEVN